MQQEQQQDYKNNQISSDMRSVRDLKSADLRYLVGLFVHRVPKNQAPKLWQ